jgi:hypothetical protein
MPDHPLLRQPMGALCVATPARSRRASSWDRSGGNNDFVVVGAGETAVLLEVEGPGCVTHLYCALAFPPLSDYRSAILRCFWDGEPAPSVEVPLGDFFCLAHARVRPFTSACVSVNPGLGASHGLSAYFPMPFATHARITVEQRGAAPLGGLFPALWYHVDYERYDAPLPADTLRFHATWRRDPSTAPIGASPNQQLHGGVNLDGADNYVALDAVGRGHMVGLHLQINNLAGGWYGEGDDMVFIDGDIWPPSLHGTGTEEVFGGGACPSSEYAGPYQGFHLIESPDYRGLVGAYRWFVHDPIRFARSIRWTIEHGHANNFANDYTSVAYWYQSEPHVLFAALPALDGLLPPLPPEHHEAAQALTAAVFEALQAMPRQEPLWRVARIAESFYAGRFADTLAQLRAG